MHNIETIMETGNFGPYENEIRGLYDFYKKVGNSTASGFLGTCISDISSDKRTGRVLIYTKHFDDSCNTESIVCLLDNSVLVEQVQKIDYVGENYQLFSWDKNGERYTHVLFGNELSLRRCCANIREFVPNRLYGDDAKIILEGLGSSNLEILNIKADQLSPNFVPKVTRSGDTPDVPGHLSSHIL